MFTTRETQTSNICSQQDRRRHQNRYLRSARRNHQTNVLRKMIQTLNKCSQQRLPTNEQKKKKKKKKKKKRKKKKKKEKTLNQNHNGFCNEY